MNIFKSSAIYLVANVLTKSISLLLMPVLTKYLAPESYGYVLLFSSLMVFFNPLLYCGCVDLIAIDYFKNPETFQQTFRKSNATVLSVAVVAMILFTVASPFLVPYFRLPVWAIITLPVVCLLSYYLELLLLLLRYRSQHFFYLKATFTKTAIEVGVSLLGLIVFHWDWISRIAGFVSGYLVATFFLTKIVSIRLLFPRIVVAEIANVLKRGAPFIVAQFIVVAFLTVDKLFIPRYFTTHELGLYGIAFQISSLLTVFSTSLISVLQPMQYRLGAHLNDANKHKLIEMIYLYMGVLLVCAIGLVVITPLLYHFFIHPQYHQSIIWVQPMVIACLLSGYSAFFINIIRQNGTGKQLIAVNLFPLLLLITLLVFLPKYFSIDGVVYAYVIVNSFILMLALYRAKKVIGISNGMFVVQLKKILNLKINEAA